MGGVLILAPMMRYMPVVKQLEQAALGPIYRLAIWLRSQVWRLRRPALIGVRALIER